MLVSQPIARIFFDVDDTLINWTGRLRPFAREVIVALVERGFEVYIWSGVGLRWDVIEAHGLRPFVSGCDEKPLHRHWERLDGLGIPCAPDYVMDDHEEIVTVFGGLHVPPWIEQLGPDRHLLRVLEDLQYRFELQPGFSLVGGERNTEAG